MVEAITQNFSVSLEVMGNTVPKEEKKTIGGLGGLPRAPPIANKNVLFRARD